VVESIQQNRSVWFQLNNTMSTKPERECYRFSIITRNGWKTLKKIFTSINNSKKSKSKSSSSGYKRSNREATNKDKK